MSNNFLTSPLGCLEKKNIFFPNGIKICHTCNKPIIETKINLNNFSLYHQNMICMKHINHSHPPSPVYSPQDDAATVDAAQVIPGVEPFESHFAGEIIDQGIDPSSFSQEADPAHIDHSLLNSYDPNTNYFTKEEFIMFKNIVEQGMQQVYEEFVQINQNITGLRQDINKLNKNVKNMNALTQIVNGLISRVDAIENYIKALEGIKGLKIQK